MWNRMFSFGSLYLCKRCVHPPQCNVIRYKFSFIIVRERENTRRNFAQFVLWILKWNDNNIGQETLSKRQVERNDITFVPLFRALKPCNGAQMWTQPIGWRQRSLLVFRVVRHDFVTSCRRHDTGRPNKIYAPVPIYHIRCPPRM